MSDKSCGHPFSEYHPLSGWQCADCGAWLDDSERTEATLAASDARIAELEKQCAESALKDGIIAELAAEVERLQKTPTWKTCDEHGQGDRYSWGCPECVREMRTKLRAVEGLQPIFSDTKVNRTEEVVRLSELQAVLRGEK